MSRASRKGKTVHEADTSNVITDLSDVPVERKDKYLKRLKKEEKANKKNYVKSGSYITLVGNKVLVKYQNAAGSVYTRYWFNAKKYPDKMAEIRKAQGYEIDGEFVELRK